MAFFYPYDSRHTQSVLDLTVFGGYAFRNLPHRVFTTSAPVKHKAGNFKGIAIWRYWLGIDADGTYPENVQGTERGDWPDSECKNPPKLLSTWRKRTVSGGLKAGAGL